MRVRRNQGGGCCSCGPSCCASPSESQVTRKGVVIDFLYLDLSVCTRCQGTDDSLDEALSEIERVLKATGKEVVVNRINVTTEELAVKHRFVSSPTIRVNGRDIQMEVKETLCESCGDLCGDEVNCRVWVYQGEEYDVPPKAMIIEAVLREVYGGQDDRRPAQQDYVLPENLRRFYAAKAKQSNPGKPRKTCC
ncbi:MAG: DUF2703 domain-containing protein [Bacillota bacterium]